MNAGKQRGVTHTKAKLTEQDVLAIRAEYQWRVPGKTMGLLAAKYDVSVTVIRAVVRRLTWKHLP